MVAGHAARAITPIGAHALHNRPSVLCVRSILQLQLAADARGVILTVDGQWATSVLPGDVVLGIPSGITFIPPHLAQEVVERSETVRQRDVFAKQRLAEGAYGSGEIDVPTWPEPIETDYQRWCVENGLVAR